MTFSLHAKYKHLYNFPLHYYNGDQGIVIGVATNYGLGGPGFPTTVGARFSVQTGWRPMQPSIKWISGLFPGAKADGAERKSPILF